MRTILPFTTGIILLIARFTFETFAYSRNKGQYGAAEVTSWVRRLPVTEGDSNPFYNAGVVEGSSRTPWMRWDSLGDEDMCHEEKTRVVKRRGWGKRMVSGGRQQRSATGNEEGMEVSGVDGREREERQTASASTCSYWEIETKNRIYNAVRVRNESSCHY